MIGVGVVMLCCPMGAILQSSHFFQIYLFSFMDVDQNVVNMHSSRSCSMGTSKNDVPSDRQYHIDLEIETMSCKIRFQSMIMQKMATNAQEETNIAGIDQGNQQLFFWMPCIFGLNR